MDLYPLKDGPTLPYAAVALAQDLDIRQIRLSANGDRLIVSGPNGPPDLSPEERQSIVKWKLHLLALVAYCSANERTD